MPVDGRSYTSVEYNLILDNVSCGIINKVEGGDIEGNIVNIAQSDQYFVRKSLGGIKYNEFAVQIGLSMAAPAQQWIEASLAGNYMRKSGQVLSGDFNHNVRSSRTFMDALITEVGFPACDAKSKEAAYLTLKFAPETIRNGPGSGKLEPMPVNIRQKLFLPSNFHVAIDGEDGNKISHVEALVVKQKNVVDEIGAERDYSREPSSMEFPNIKMTMAEAHADSWYIWHEDFVIKGNAEQSKHRNGAVQYLDPTCTKTLLELTMYSLGIIEVAPDPLENATDKIRHVTVECYMEHLAPKWS